MQQIIIPKWLYDREVTKNGKEATDRIMSAYNAVAVESWREAIDLEVIKEKVNHG